MEGRGDVRSGRGCVVPPHPRDPGDSPYQGPRPALSPDLTCDLPVTVHPAPAPYHLHRLQATSHASATGTGPCDDPTRPSEDSGWEASPGTQPLSPHWSVITQPRPLIAPPRPNLGPAPPRLPSTIGSRDRRFPGGADGNGLEEETKARWMGSQPMRAYSCPSNCGRPMAGRSPSARCQAAGTKGLAVLQGPLDPRGAGLPGHRLCAVP
ncbi:hypothetical protein AB1E19_014799 [Capra hircus]